VTRKGLSADPPAGFGAVMVHRVVWTVLGPTVFSTCHPRDSTARGAEGLAAW